jgi:hypothetical protein
MSWKTVFIAVAIVVVAIGGFWWWYRTPSASPVPWTCGDLTFADRARVTRAELEPRVPTKAADLKSASWALKPMPGVSGVLTRAKLADPSVTTFDLTHYECVPIEHRSSK